MVKKLTVILESDTGLNTKIKDESTGKIYTNDEIYEKVKKNHGGVWEGYIAVEKEDGTKFIKSTEDNKHKLG
ncbi:MAG: DUF3892 domain-containing protein [Cetobacterium sp.]|uniref:DUF3892 domain-containing protein n=1 Tax=Cetobacterium sp. TaxID=2071632 RepID=UPI003EE64AC4